MTKDNGHILTLTKKNYSKLQFTIVYYTSKLWYYNENYGTSINEEKKTCQITKNKETLIYNEKTMEMYPNN